MAVMKGTPVPICSHAGDCSLRFPHFTNEPGTEHKDGILIRNDDDRSITEVLEREGLNQMSGKYEKTGKIV